MACNKPCCAHCGCRPCVCCCGLCAPAGPAGPTIMALELQVNPCTKAITGGFVAMTDGTKLPIRIRETR